MSYQGPFPDGVNLDTFSVVILTLGSFVAFILTYAIGANDVANALGTSVGSKAISLRNACILAGIFEFLGAAIMGSFVSGTLKGGIVDPNKFEGELEVFILGIFCALLASAIWLLIASFFGLPVSTTQSIVGGLVGFGLVEKGSSAVSSKTIINIIISWISSPILGGLLSFSLYWPIQKFILSKEDCNERSLKYFSLISTFTFIVLSLFIVSSQAKLFPELNQWYIILGSLVGVGAIAFVITHLVYIPYLKRRDVLETSNLFPSTTSIDEESNNENIKLLEAEERFKLLMIITAVFVAFAHGANDVANAVGPFAAIVEYHLTRTIDPKAKVPIYIVIIGGVGIVIGLATLGYKVMQTVGEKITKLTYSRGYASQLGTALTVMLATYLSIPISSTTTLVGAVSAVGLIRPLDVDGVSGGTLNKKMLVKIFLSWIFTVLIGGILTIIFYLISKYTIISAFD